MLSVYSNIKKKDDVKPLLGNDEFVLSLCDNLTSLMEKSLSPNGSDYICCTREYSPVLALYVKILKFWKECIILYKSGNLSVYLAFSRIIHEAYVKLVYLCICDKEKLNDFRLNSYRNRKKLYELSTNMTDGLNMVRNIKFLEDLSADGFSESDVSTRKKTNFDNFKAISDKVFRETYKEYSEIMYIAICGMSSDVIHSDWGELRQLHLCDLGDGMMAPNIDNVKWRHYRIILPIAYTVANAISFFIPFINTSKSIVEIGDALMAMDSEIIRVLNLVMEKMLDDYNEDPDKFMIV